MFLYTRIHLVVRIHEYGLIYCTLLRGPVRHALENPPSDRPRFYILTVPFNDKEGLACKVSVKRHRGFGPLAR